MQYDLLTLARPYATACYQYAAQQQQIAAWQQWLQCMAELLKNPELYAILTAPETKEQQQFTLIEKLLSALLNNNLTENILTESMMNCLKLLLSHKRLVLIPEILIIFEQLKAQAENSLQVQVTTAITLADDSKAALTKQLTSQLNKTISPSFTINPAILGGAIIRLNDNTVLDGSLKTQLQQMKAQFGSTGPSEPST